MKAIGLVSEYHCAEELSHADVVITSFSDIDVSKLEAMYR